MIKNKCMKEAYGWSWKTKTCIYTFTLRYAHIVYINTVINKICLSFIQNNIDKHQEEISLVSIDWFE